MKRLTTLVLFGLLLMLATTTEAGPFCGRQPLRNALKGALKGAARVAKGAARVVEGAARTAARVNGNQANLGCAR